jgi:hypothetical protein
MERKGKEGEMNALKLQSTPMYPEEHVQPDVPHVPCPEH